MSEWTNTFEKIDVQGDIVKVPVDNADVAFLVWSMDPGSLFWQLCKWLPRDLAPYEGSFYGVDRRCNPQLLLGVNLLIENLNDTIDYVDDDHILVLSEKNYNSFSGSKDNVFVEEECSDDEVFLLDKNTWFKTYLNSKEFLVCRCPGRNMRFAIQGE